MAAPKEEQVCFPTSSVKREFVSNIVEISSSSEKSSTGQALETGEEATSSGKGSTLQQFSAEFPHKRPRLQASAEGIHSGLAHRESVHFSTSASNFASEISRNGAVGGRELHNDDRVVDNVAVNDNIVDDDLPDDFLEPLDSPLASSPPPSIQMEPIHGHPSSKDMAKLMFKQFWKAGDYDSVPSIEDLDLGNGMEHVRVHPKFLHSNATSHKWALGAIAELLDNALDEAVNGATLVNVDMIRNPRDARPMLMVEDDGGGMDPEHMRQCMSLGYSAKSKVANTIGQYGNGFKTSTMRLGADVIVFSRHKSKGGSLPTQSIGLLSYTYLTATGQDDIIVPMVDYEVHAFGLRKLVRGTLDDWNKNLETLLQWSPYDTEQGLFDQLQRIKGQGTIVIVYNLWEDEEGELELDFDADAHDIQLRGANRDEKNILMASKYPNCKHFFTYKYSLRSYASILYLRLPRRFRMFLRGEQVVHHRLVSDLMLTEQVKYKPVKVSVLSHKDAVTVVTLGFVKDAKEHIDVQGFNVYHKNRLIKPFWRVWNYPGIQGRGIFGVLEANFVEPAHDKQGFERTTVFARLEARLIEIQKSYWSKNCEEIGYVGNASKKKTQRPEGASNDPSSEKASYPGTPSTVPVVTRASLSPSTTEKSKHPLDNNHVKAGQPVPWRSILSSGTEALPSRNVTRAASHDPSLSENIGRASSHCPSELGTKDDARGTVALHVSAEAVPFTSREVLASQDAHPCAQTSMQLGVTGKIGRTPCVSITRSQPTEVGRVKGASSLLVSTLSPAQSRSAEVLSRNGNESEAQTEDNSIRVAEKSTSSLVAPPGAITDQIEEQAHAAPEPDPQPTAHISANKDHLLSSNAFKASEYDESSLPDGNQVNVGPKVDQHPGFDASRSPLTLDVCGASAHVSLVAESLQDSSEALISPSSQCDVPESSQCSSGNAFNVSITSMQTQEGRARKMTRSMLQLRQSHAKAAQLESAGSQQYGSKTQEPEMNGTTDVSCLAKVTLEEGDMSVSTVVATVAEDTISLESINILEGKLDVVKQRVRTLQSDLDQIYSERDLLKGELEEEQRRRSLVEEELKKKLQAVTSQARKLEAANKLMQVCQR